MKTPRPSSSSSSSRRRSALARRTFAAPTPSRVDAAFPMSCSHLPTVRQYLREIRQLHTTPSTYLSPSPDGTVITAARYAILYLAYMRSKRNEKGSARVQQRHLTELQWHQAQTLGSGGGDGGGDRGGDRGGDSGGDRGGDMTRDEEEEVGDESGDDDDDLDAEDDDDLEAEDEDDQR